MPTQKFFEAVIPPTGDVVERLVSQVLEFRRDIHRYPELSRHEFRTTAAIATALEQAGLSPVRFEHTGLMVDIGQGPISTALRADIDALPIQDETDSPYSSQVVGVTHACGHDVHTAVVLGTALALNELDRQGKLAGRVRCVFQPAEEVMPGGAEDAIEQGALEGVPRILSLHCDPRVDVGRVGVRTGALTSASSVVKIEVTGRGGHTSRPQLTEDLVYVLSKIATEIPTVLSRRLDARSAVSLVWGYIQAGSAANAIPVQGQLGGTLRCQDYEIWHQIRTKLGVIAQQVADPYGVKTHVHPIEGVAPVVNTLEETALLEAAAVAEFGREAVVPVPQSMGGEDFSAYLETVPGAMIRLGTRTPGGKDYDLHQGDYQVDERCIEVGMRVLANAALRSSHFYGAGTGGE